MTAILVVAVAIYFLIPGHPQLPAPGMPVGEVGAALVAVALLVAVAARSVTITRRSASFAATLLVVAALVRVLAGVESPQTGWTAAYYANDSWQGRPEWSSDFRWADATRLDAAIAFDNDQFPTFYLNDYRFDTGNRREVTQPMSVQWTGHLRLTKPETVKVVARFRGAATVAVDGQVVVDHAGPDSRTVDASLPLQPGDHALLVTYRKPADLDGQMHVTAFAGADELKVTPRAVGSQADGGGPWLLAAYAADIVALGLLAIFAGVVAVTRWRDRAARPELAVAAATFAWFGVQGWRVAGRFTNRFYTLTAGDDWWGFESRARDILHHGPLMMLGQAPGHGAAYFFHPFYSYFLAVVHAVVGESLFGPIFVQFLILAAVSVLMWRLARDFFGELPAAVALAALIVIFELDFARYYTVTLLSENLYILTVSLTITSLAQWARGGRGTALLAAGFWGGVSSITRPAMLMSLLPILAAVVALGRLERGSWNRGLRAAAVCAAAWMAPVSLTALRNWIASARFVLVSDGLGGGVLKYNIPDSVAPEPYLASYSGGVLSAAWVMARIAVEHPVAFATTQARKFGFALGMVHWHEGYRPHPELAAITALYVAMLVGSRALRQPALWPAHAFVITHVLSMGLTSPWNYGYRLILPPFVLTTTLSVAAAVALVLRYRGPSHVTPAAVAA